MIARMSLLIRLLAAVLLLTVLSFADSRVRIVRLSSMDGDVQIDRNTGAGLEKAFLNLPITQGVKLQTGSEGRAEVEFEDGSVVRLAPNSKVEFPQLELRDSGVRVSRTEVQQGTVYVNFRGGKEDEFTASFVRESLVLKDAAHFRIQVNDAQTALAVFKGAVTLEGASGSVDLEKNQSVTFDLADHDQYQIAKVEDAPFDTWDKEQDKYHNTYLSKNHDYSPNAYGVSDLNYYGNYFNAPGYGMVWQPYFVSMGWDPFMDGGWVWFPGSGYSWVSAYPWGWTPYHCGSWLYGPSFGWAWQPGGCGSWFGFPPVINAPATFRQPQPPSGQPGRGTIVMAPRPIISNSLISSHRMVIENNSAGLGIPRGGIKDLSHLSSTVRQSGSVTTNLRPMPSSAPMTPRPMINNPGTPRPSSVSRPSNVTGGGSPGSTAPSRSFPTPRGTTKK